MSRPGKAPTTAPRHRKGLSPGVCLVRGKHPQPPLVTERGSRPGYVSSGESTHNRPSAHKGALGRGMSRPGEALTTAPRHTKGLSPGVWLARGKHPQPPLGTQRGSRPGYDSPGESTHISPTGGPLSPRYTGFRQPPQGPAWPRGNYLHDF